MCGAGCEISCSAENWTAAKQIQNRQPLKMAAENWRPKTKFSKRMLQGIQRRLVARCKISSPLLKTNVELWTEIKYNDSPCHINRYYPLNIQCYDPAIKINQNDYTVTTITLSYDIVCSGTVNHCDGKRYCGEIVHSLTSKVFDIEKCL